MNEGESFEKVIDENIRYVYNACLTRLKDPADAEECAICVLADYVSGGAEDFSLDRIIDTACLNAVARGAEPSDVRRDIDVPPGIYADIVSSVKHRIFDKKYKERQFAPRPAAVRKKKKNRAVSALLIALCAAVAVAAALIAGRRGGGDAPREQINVDHFEAGGAGEIEELLGIKLTPPEDAEDVVFTIEEGNIAEASFIYCGHAYILRASERTDDFSKVDAEEAWVESVDHSTDAVLTTLLTDYDRIMKLTWKEENVNFILVNSDGAEKDDEVKVYAAFKYN